MQQLRIPLLVSILLGLSACGPSSSVKRTTPVANLQSYQVALVRVAGIAGLAQFAPVLEFATASSLQDKCSFGSIVGPSQIGQLQPDLILDLNIQSSQRGGSSFVQNPNIAEVKVTMVLSDGIDESLLGSALIVGKSSAVMTGQDPENQALEAVGKRVATILAKSGCSGVRIARQSAPVEQPAPPAPKPGEGPVTPEQLAQAEAANSEGKRFFRAADIQSAKAQFQQAVGIVEDPRYFFNLCLAHEALNEYDAAVQACQSALSANPESRLQEKANQRLAIIAEKRGA